MMRSHACGDDSSPSVAAVSNSNSCPIQNGIFRKEGEYWTIGYGRKAFRIRDIKGIGYIAHLLQHPGREFHVLELVGAVAGRSSEETSHQLERVIRIQSEYYESRGIRITGLSDAGEMLDEQAKNDYRRRLLDLHKELEEAEKLGAVQRAQRAEHEIHALTKELSRAVGLKGRNRRAGSASERARQSVNKTIRTALQKIAKNDAALPRLLSRRIRTGNFCCYQPDPDLPIDWHFAATEINLNPPTSTESLADMKANELLMPPGLAALPFAEGTLFIGRELESSTIHAVIDRAASGRGSIILLGGIPGVGKSRLAMEMARYASRLGFQHLIGCCYDREEQLPFQPFAEMVESSVYQASSVDEYRRHIGENDVELAHLVPSLRRFFPNISKPMDLATPVKRLYLSSRLTAMLDRLAQNYPQLTIVEDLHWADESSLALLIHLAKRVGQLRVVIIGTYRDVCAEYHPRLPKTLEALIRLGVRPLRLRGLSRHEVAVMLKALSGRKAPEHLVSLMFEETNGNPFFIEELYRHLLEEGKIFDRAGEFQPDIRIDEFEVPDNLRLVVNCWLERLEDLDRRVLTAAAIIGGSFNLQLLSTATQTEVCDLLPVIEKAHQMGIITTIYQRLSYAFCNELVRQTLLARICASGWQPGANCISPIQSGISIPRGSTNTPVKWRATSMRRNHAHPAKESSSFIHGQERA